MSLPSLLKENERTDAEWRRKTRDLVNQIARRLLGQGPTIERPKGVSAGTMYYDLTLSKPVWLDAAGTWRDAAGTAV